MATNPNDAVFKYLQQQNRPYSANDILMNLHKEIGKTQMQKSLDQLTEKGKIKEKVYGKQKVYSVIQDDSKAEDLQKDLLELDAQCGQAEGKLRLAENELRLSETKARELLAMPTTKDAVAELEQLEDRVGKLKKRLHELTTSSVMISAADKAKIVADHEQKTKEWRKRKRICVDMMDSILEGYPKNKKALIEEVGIETDEAVGVAPL